MTQIAHIQTLLPRYKTTAEELIRWAENYLDDRDEFRKFKFLVQRSAIETKYSVTGDFCSRAQVPFFAKKSTDTATRLEKIKDATTNLGYTAGKQCLEQAGLQPEEVTHMIAVSCTGIFAPGLELIWGEKLGLRSDITRFAVNFMGCYAALQAIKLGNLICRDNPDARILVIAAEICTLHMQQTGRTDDLLSTALFGDGVAAWTMQAHSTSSVEAIWLGGITEVTGHRDLMAWDIDNNGFSMTLSQEIPGVLMAKAGEVINKLLCKINNNHIAIPTGNLPITAAGVLNTESIDLSHIDYFAIHPGGKNILDAFATALKLPEEAMRHSTSVLNRYGNMSSPTIMFVLKDIVQDFKQSNKQDAMVMCAAFGPGLTMETGLIKLSRT